MNIVHAGNSFIRRWQRQYYLKRLEEQTKEASVHAALDDLEQVCKAVSLIWQHSLELQDTPRFWQCTVFLCC